MKRVLLTGLVLLALFGLSLALSYFDLGRAALPVALTIAAVKAALVAWIFMELSKASASIRLAVVAATTLLAVLIGFVVTDLETRDAPAVISK